jgi:NADPH:quinone reductase-like Zn-dependent oxidoreductase
MNIYHFWIVKFFDFLVGKLSSTSSTSESVNSMGTSDIVLVAGGTGGVGRRVVDVLRKKGIPVRVLVLCCDLPFWHELPVKNLSLNNEYSIMFLTIWINIYQVRNEEKARKMLGSDVDLVSYFDLICWDTSLLLK